MSSHNDPLHPAIIKTTAYCPDSLALRVSLPASINYVSDDLSPSSSADALTTLAKKGEKVRRCVRACVCENERTSVGGCGEHLGP